MNLRKILENVGLSEKEARTYLALLSLDEETPRAIAIKARLKRPTVYAVLEQLQQRGYVSRVKRGNTWHYRALNPYALIEDRFHKYTALEKAVPELLALNANRSSRPEMRVFEGKRGLIQVMEDTLNSSTEILAWADMAEITNGLFVDYWQEYIERRIEIGLWCRMVLCDSKEAREFKKRGADELREAYLVSRKRYPFKNEMNIYDDKICIISHEDLVGVIIENNNIANSQRSIFRMCFEYAKQLDQG